MINKKVNLMLDLTDPDTGIVTPTNCAIMLGRELLKTSYISEAISDLSLLMSTSETGEFEMNLSEEDFKRLILFVRRFPAYKARPMLDAFNK